MIGPLRRAAARAAVPFGYLLLAVGASWPLARDFATDTVGEVHYGEGQAIWVLWHTLQALAGQTAWSYATQLFWPHGISVLLDGVGPVNGILPLRFWPWGAAAAYNGAALLGLSLSGWCLYALGRGIGLARGPAFVSGALYLLWTVAICAPLLAAIGRVLRDPALEIALGGVAAYYSPDVLSLVLPGLHQSWTRWLYPDVMLLPDLVWASTLARLNPTSTWYGTGLETAIGIPLTAIALGALGCRERAGRTGIVFGLAFAVLCLGPRLRVDGEMTAVRLPYVVAQRLPGLDVMRTPGRFMFLGAIGFALAAGVGVSVLARRRPSQTAALATAAAAVAAIECWPHAWPQTALPPVSPFHRQIAADPAGGAVLDLPHGWTPRNDRASAYMYCQTVHRRPIAWAYLSRGYRIYPTSGLDALWRADVPAGPALRARLRDLGYRAVIVHRYPLTFQGGRVEHGRDGTPVGPAQPPAAERVMAEAFPGEPPIYEDDRIAVWAVSR